MSTPLQTVDVYYVEVSVWRTSYDDDGGWVGDDEQLQSHPTPAEFDTIEEAEQLADRLIAIANKEA